MGGGGPCPQLWIISKCFWEHTAGAFRHHQLSVYEWRNHIFCPGVTISILSVQEWQFPYFLSRSDTFHTFCPGVTLSCFLSTVHTVRVKSPYFPPRSDVTICFSKWLASPHFRSRGDVATFFCVWVASPYFLCRSYITVRYLLCRSDITIVCRAMEFGQFPLDSHKCYFLLTSCKSPFRFLTEFSRHFYFYRYFARHFLKGHFPAIFILMEFSHHFHINRYFHAIFILCKVIFPPFWSSRFLHNQMFSPFWTFLCLAVDLLYFWLPNSQFWDLDPITV